MEISAEDNSLPPYLIRALSSNGADESPNKALSKPTTAQFAQPKAELLFVFAKYHCIRKCPDYASKDGQEKYGHQRVPLAIRRTRRSLAFIDQTLAAEIAFERAFAQFKFAAHNFRR